MFQVGVIGGYGDVGSEVLRGLQSLGITKVKSGGRSLSKVTCGMREAFHNVVWQQVDVNDPGSLLRFASDCNVVVNCAGPFNHINTCVPQIVQQAKADYIDLGYDPSFEHNSRTTVIFDAGSAPGVSGLLPQYMAGSMQSVSSVLQAYSVRDIFTPTAAEDYLVGVYGDNSRALPIPDISKPRYEMFHPYDLPCFDQPAFLFRYFDKESEMVSKRMGIQCGEWYIAMTEGPLMKAFTRNSITFRKNKDEAVAALCRSSAEELSRGEPYMVFLLELTGIDRRGTEKTLTVLFRAKRQAALSGIAAAATVKSILLGYIEPGFYGLLAEVPCIKAIMDDVINSGAVKHCSIMDDMRIADIMQVTEGEL